MCINSVTITAILPYKSQTKQLKRFKQLTRNFFSIKLKQLFQNKKIVISGRCITVQYHAKKDNTFLFFENIMIRK